MTAAMRIGLGLGLPKVPAIVAGGLASGLPAWVYQHPAVAADLDFVHQRYFWGGAEHVQGDFDTWTGVTLTPDEGATTAAARGIGLALAKFAADANLTLAALTKGISTPAGTSVVAEIWDGSSNESIRITATATDWVRQVRDANVGQATYNTSLDTGVAHAFSISNKDAVSFRAAIDGVASTADTTGTAAGPLTTLVIGSANAYTARVVVLTKLASDAEHAALTEFLLASVPPVAASYLLMEDGSYLLLEDGSKILME